jgi:hypothetical protein
VNWVVTLLIGILAIILIITIAVLLKVFLASNSAKKASAEKKPDLPVRTGSGIASSGSSASTPKPQPKPQPKSQPLPEPEKSLAKKVLEEEEADPVAEAEVFLTYGLKDKAIELLAKHLVDNPSDEAAKTLLEQAKQ